MRPTKAVANTPVMIRPNTVVGKAPTAPGTASVAPDGRREDDGPRKYNLAPPPTTAYTADVALAVAAVAMESNQEQQVGRLLNEGQIVPCASPTMMSLHYLAMWFPWCYFSISFGVVGCNIPYVLCLAGPGLDHLSGLGAWIGWVPPSHLNWLVDSQPWSMLPL